MKKSFRVAPCCKNHGQQWSGRSKISTKKISNSINHISQNLKNMLLIATTLLLLVILVIALDQLQVLYYSSKFPSVKSSFPLLGNVFPMVKDPVKFWEQQRDLSPNGVSANFLLGKLMLFVTNRDLCHRVMTDQVNFKLMAHPNAKYLFGRDNLIYMARDEHKAFRRLFLSGLFSDKPLMGYIKVQQSLLSETLQSQSKVTTFEDLIPILRETNARISQTAFVGPYLTLEISAKLANDILLVTNGFLVFPFPYPFPGTELGNSYQAKLRMQAELQKVVQSAWQRIKVEKEDAVCVLDYWIEQLDHCDTRQTEMLANTLVDFLFAAQDATTSALMWCIDILVQRPDVVEQIRAELAEIGAQEDTPISDYFEKLSYTKKVAMDVFRFRPPVPMVPHIAQGDITVNYNQNPSKSDKSETVTFPKGSIVIPSISFTSENEPNAARFEPENFADHDFNQVLVFGAGAHKCPGRKYAAQVLTVFLVLMARYEFTPLESDQPRNPDSKQSSNPYLYLPTLFPAFSKYKITASN
jgi:cytochrome P450 family 710 subfamily A protein